MFPQNVSTSRRRIVHSRKKQQLKSHLSFLINQGNQGSLKLRLNASSLDKWLHNQRVQLPSLSILPKWNSPRSRLKSKPEKQKTLNWAVKVSLHEACLSNHRVTWSQWISSSRYQAWQYHHYWWSILGLYWLWSFRSSLI